MLGDGSESICDLFELAIQWDGAVRTIEVEAAETIPLVGMGLLDGFILKIDAAPGGEVIISPRSTDDPRV